MNQLNSTIEKMATEVFQMGHMQPKGHVLEIRGMLNLMPLLNVSQNSEYDCEMLQKDVLVLSYQPKLIKTRAKVASLNDCAVSFLSRAAANLCW